MIKENVYPNIPTVKEIICDEEKYIEFLMEKGIINDINQDPTTLSEEGLAGKVRLLLAEMEQQRYMGKEDVSMDVWVKKAEEIMQEKP